MRYKYYFLGVVISFFMVGCGVGHLGALSTENMGKHDSVISLSKERYTGFQASGGMSDFRQSQIKDRDVAEFKISTNEVREKVSLGVFLNDMKSYCNFRGGTYEELSQNTELLNAIINKNTTVTTKTYNLTAAFECGPPGHGTISTDWTKFNPDVCRKLENQKLEETVTTVNTDKEKIWETYQNLPRFVCRSGEVNKFDKAMFIGTIHRTNRGGAGSFGDAIQLVVRLNQGKKDIPINEDIKLY